jgi:NitT/TauT family transport system substrate-binding protein
MKTRWPIYLTTIAAAAIAAGCGPEKPATTTTTTAPTTASATASKPFVVGYNQWIGYVGLFMAIDKGYFKDAGLDVQPKQFSGPADGVTPLVANQLDCDMTTADTVVLLEPKASSNPVTNVYVIDTSNGADGVIAEKKYKTIQDLKGQTVAATLGQCNELLLLMALEKAGMTEKDVKLTNMDADTAGAAVMSGKVAAAVTWEPWLSKAASTGGNIIFTSKDAKNLIMDTIAVSKTTLDTRPADVKAYITAYSKGAAYAIAHPDEAAQVAGKYLGSKPEDAKGMLTKVLLYDAAANKKLIGTTAAPGPVFTTAKKIGEFFVAQKQLPSVPDVSKTFTADYLP